VSTTVIFSYAKDKLCTVQQAFDYSDMIDVFHVPLSSEAASELLDLQHNLHNTILDANKDDKWIFNIKNNSHSIPSRLYKLSFSETPNHFPSQWIWKSKCTSKHKFFAWLIVHDRLNTKDMLLRRH
jgi:hydroxymethylpyrimidine pyrophosphatase-like HAD family hydrolase